MPFVFFSHVIDEFNWVTVSNQTSLRSWLCRSINLNHHFLDLPLVFSIKSVKKGSGWDSIQLSIWKEARCVLPALIHRTSIQVVVRYLTASVVWIWILVHHRLKLVHADRFQVFCALSRYFSLVYIADEVDCIFQIRKSSAESRKSVLNSIWSKSSYDLKLSSQVVYLSFN